jgi:hypothetical protein
MPNGRVKLCQVLRLECRPGRILSEVGLLPGGQATDEARLGSTTSWPGLGQKGFPAQYPVTAASAKVGPSYQKTQGFPPRHSGTLWAHLTARESRTTMLMVLIWPNLNYSATTPGVAGSLNCVPVDCGAGEARWRCSLTPQMPPMDRGNAEEHGDAPQQALQARESATDPDAGDTGESSSPGVVPAGIDRLRCVGDLQSGAVRFFCPG